MYCVGLTPRVLLLLCCALILVSTPSAHAQFYEYEYFDTSFEEGHAWFSDSTGSAWLTQEQAHTGDWSYKVTGQLFSTILPQTGEDLIKITYWHKGDGYWTFNRHGFGDATDWTQRTHFFRPHPSRNDQRYEWDTNGGTAYIDDAKVINATPQHYTDYLNETLSQFGVDAVQINTDSHTARRIPKTLHALKTGEPWKMLMLGDSIVSDTFASYFDVAIESKYPNADLQLIESTRSGTGMNWYAGGEFIDDEWVIDLDLGRQRIQDYVLDYNPDVIFIGGISHGWISDNYAVVVDLIREHSDAEIILTTGAAGSVAYGGDARTSSSFTLEIPEDSTGFRARVRDIASDKGAAYFDTYGTWGQFTLDMGPTTPYQDLLRDALHMNQYGMAVVASAMRDWIALAPQQGDLNFDGSVDGLDIDPFIEALLGQGIASTLDPYWADFNLDGEVNGLDIDGFVDALSIANITAGFDVPEPTTFVIAMLGMALVPRRRGVTQPTP